MSWEEQVFVVLIILIRLAKYVSVIPVKSTTYYEILFYGHRNICEYFCSSVQFTNCSNLLVYIL